VIDADPQWQRDIYGAGIRRKERLVPINVHLVTYFSMVGNPEGTVSRSFVEIFDRNCHSSDEKEENRRNAGAKAAHRSVKHH